MSGVGKLPTGKPVAEPRYAWGSVPEADRWGVGVVGLHEGLTAVRALETSGHCRTAAVCDTDPAKVGAALAACPSAAAYDDAEGLVRDPNVAIVAVYTPDSTHAELIERAFLAGKHVVCTKPLVDGDAPVGRLLAAADRTGARLQVGQSTRFYEPFLRQRELFESGEFGEAEVYDASYCHRMDWFYEKSPWSVKEAHWAYLGLSHPVDLVRWYLGAIARVQAAGHMSRLGRESGIAHPDVVTAHLVSEDGRVGRAFGHYGMHELPKGRSLIEGVLYGSQGTSLARYPDLRHTYVGSEGVEREEDWRSSLAGYYYRHELLGMHYGEFCNYFDHFGHALRTGGPNSPDLREGLETVLVMRAVVEALATGGSVEVARLPG